MKKRYVNKSAKKEKKEDKTEPESKEELNAHDRKVIYGILIIIGLFAIFFIGFKILSRGPVVKTIGELHQENMDGKLHPDEGYMYNGFSFVKTYNTWFTQIQKAGTQNLYNIQFRFGPREVESIPVSGNIYDFKDFNGTYILFDPLSYNLNYTAVASAELSLKISQVLMMLPVAACTQNETFACYSIPIVNCSTATNPVIYLEKGDDPAIIRENAACIRVIGDKIDIVKSTDKLLYILMGIMD